MGSVAGGGAFAALREGKGLPSLGMAGLARFWERGSRRLRLPRFGSGFLGPQDRASADPNQVLDAHGHERRGLAGSEHGGI